MILVSSPLLRVFSTWLMHEFIHVELTLTTWFILSSSEPRSFSCQMLVALAKASERHWSNVLLRMNSTTLYSSSFSSGPYTFEPSMSMKLLKWPL